MPVKGQQNNGKTVHNEHFRLEGHLSEPFESDLRVQVPLLDGPETLKEWNRLKGSAEGSTDSLPDGAKQGYQKAQGMVQSRLANEESVATSKPADTDLLTAYMAYIKLEEVIVFTSALHLCTYNASVYAMKCVLISSP